MKYKIGTVLARFDIKKNQVVVIKIADMDNISYAVLTHNGNWHLMNDDDIVRLGFKRLWWPELDEIIEHRLRPI